MLLALDCGQTVSLGEVDTLLPCVGEMFAPAVVERTGWRVDGVNHCLWGTSSPRR